MITCILLCAGLSERFGSPKALATLGTTNVIQYVQKTLLASKCDSIIVVLGAHATLIEPSIFIHSKISVVHNKDYILGQTSSVQAGWREVTHQSQGIMFLPVDCPLVQSSSIDRVIEHFKTHQPDILIPSYENKKGHPPIFHQRLTPEILNLPTDKGINSLFGSYPPETIDIDDRGIVQSFNTPEELEDLKLP